MYFYTRCFLTHSTSTLIDDVKATFAAFRRLDVGNYGTLNSRTVIEGEIWRIRSCKNLAEMAGPQPTSPLSRHGRSYSADDSLELSHSSIQYNPYSYVMQSPNPYLQSPISMRSAHYDAYEHWNRSWNQQ